MRRRLRAGRATAGEKASQNSIIRPGSRAELKRTRFAAILVRNHYQRAPSAATIRPKPQPVSAIGRHCTAGHRAPNGAGVDSTEETHSNLVTKYSYEASGDATVWSGNTYKRRTYCCDKDYCNVRVRRVFLILR